MNVLSPISDNVQGVAEMVEDRLPKASRVYFVTDKSKEKISSFGTNIVEHRKYL